MTYLPSILFCLASWTATAADSAAQSHWAFKPIASPDLPEIVDAAWPRNGVDHFIQSRIEAAGLSPAPSASRYVLIRRLYFDLLGIPPSADEVLRFVDDPDPDAYEHLLDRLLASPAYGERWGQHWLDLARFAETDGYEHDKTRPEAWRYRDWVINALNEDIPYDRFIRMQLAGDELFPGDRHAAIATGFALCGPDMPDINLQQERRHVLLNEITATVGSVFLALQIGCAQCHDHKYDPVSQRDFYALRAFFDNVDLFAKKLPYRQLTEKRSAPQGSFLMVRGDFRQPGERVKPEFLPIANPDRALVAQQPGSSAGSRAALAEWLTGRQHPLTARVMANRLWQFHFGRGLVATPSDFGLKGAVPTHPLLLDWLASEFRRCHWSLKRMHRLLLNSATYRQASRAEKSRRAEQLSGHSDLRSPDSSSWRARTESDPDNLTWNRMLRRRLEGEAIRDNLLSVSRRLTHRRTGPGIMSPLPKELLQTIRKDHWRVHRDQKDHFRRSIYLFVRRNLRYPMFEAFDRPDTNTSCPKRDRSTTAPQALTLLNSKASLENARWFAARVWRRAPLNREAQIEFAFLSAFARKPSITEKTVAISFLDNEMTQLVQGGSDAALLPADLGISAAEGTALTYLCLALINSNEFIYID